MKTLLHIILALSLSITWMFADTEWRAFTNKEGKSFEGKVVKVDVEAEQATVINKKSKRTFTIQFNVLTAGDVEYLKQWTAPVTEHPEAEVADKSLGEAKKRFYPNTKEEISEQLKEIMAVGPPRGIEEKQQQAVNTLNAFRYLCGVHHNVKADKKMVKEATEAANACEKNGKLSHDIGGYTDKCNITTSGDIVTSVTGYINDHGLNNRQKRGHRLWCLNPGMKKTGFGSAGAAYSAMWALDGSGASKGGERAYPGPGFFPLKYLHGDGWSLYLSEIAPKAADLKVEVFKLTVRPDKPYSSKADIPGEVVPVNYVHTFENAINFEPKTDTVHKGGIFWVRVSGKGVRESYLVELY